VLDHRGACGTARQPDGKVFAQPEHRIVPALAHRDDRQTREVRMLFGKECLNERNVDYELGGGPANVNHQLPTTNHQPPTTNH
jgi:hypothetical protein